MSAFAAPPVEVVEVDGEGEDEERLGGLLEGALGEVGGAEVGDRDEDRGQHPAPRAEVAERRQRRQRGEDADREDLADEGLAEADPRQRRDRVGERVRAQRVAGFRRRPEAAAQPLGPGQVQAEVVVEADADDAPAPAHRERDREDQGDDDGDRQALAQQRAAVAAPRLPPEQQRRGDDQGQQADRSRWSRAPAPARASR